MGRNKCHGCAFHLYVNGNRKRKRKVFRNISLDNVDFFKENFSKVVKFHCGLNNLYVYLIIYQAFKVIDLLKTDYYCTDFDVETCAFTALISIFKREKKVSNKQKPSIIYKICNYDIINPNIYYHDELLFKRLLIFPSLHLFRGGVVNLFPKYVFSVVSYRGSVPDDHVIHKHTHCVYQHHRHDIKTRIFLCQENSNKCDLRLILLSYTILRLYYLLISGNEVKMPRFHPLVGLHPECSDIMGAFESCCRNRTLFDLCRSALFRCTPSFSALENYINMFVFNSILKKRILINNCDIASDAENLNMRTFLQHLEKNRDSLMYDRVIECYCCESYYTTPYMHFHYPSWRNCVYYG